MIACLTIFWTCGAQAALNGESRVALVIGNADYSFSPLTNPVNDAKAMSKALVSLGFEVTTLENASYTQMVDGVRRFGDRLRGTGGVALFYFAGHGVQMGGINYLVPVGSDIRKEHEVKYNALNVNQVVDEMDFSDNRVNIVILDACRNNPFARSFRSVQSGLAQIDAPSGTLIAFATAPGEVANDGSGNNGLYTEHLLANITQPGLPVEQVFKQVRVGVLDATRGEQVPWESSSLIGDFFFSDPLPSDPQISDTPVERVASLAPAKVDPKALDLVFWESVKDSGNPADYQAYLHAYPQGVFAGLAKLRMDGLNKARNESRTESGTAQVVDSKDSLAPSPATPQAPQEPATQTRLSYLEKAQAALEAGRLVAPAGDNAVEWSARELAQHPRSGQARGIIRDVFDRVNPQIEQMLTAGESDAATKTIALLKVLSKYATREQLTELERLALRLEAEPVSPPRPKSGLDSLPSSVAHTPASPTTQTAPRVDERKSASVWSFPGSTTTSQSLGVPVPASMRSDPVPQPESRPTTTPAPTPQVSQGPINMGGGWVTLNRSAPKTGTQVQWQLLDSGTGPAAGAGSGFAEDGSVDIEAK